MTVRKLREERGWSQEKLAEVAQLNRSYVGDVERGNAVPSLVTLEKIAVAMGLKISDLVLQCEALRGMQAVYNLKLTAIAC